MHTDARQTLPAPLASIFDNYEDSIQIPRPWTEPITIGIPLSPGKQALNHMNLLEYHRHLDNAQEQDYDDLMWTPLSVLDHSPRSLRPDDLHIKIKVLWTNGEIAWVRLPALRLQDPYLLIKYAIKRRLLGLGYPEWAWIRAYANNDDTLSQLTIAFNARRGEPTYKFGIEVPTNVAQAMTLDQQNNDTLWHDAIVTELHQINDYETFRTLDGQPIPVGYKKIPYQIIFDVKFDLRRKARLVAGGHRTDPPVDDIYSGVVGMDTVRLGFVLANLNDLEVCAADIGNAFLYGKTQEKVYVIAGKEFGPLHGQPLIIDKGLYGLRSSSARFHEHLSAKLRLMGYRPSHADSDFWMKDCSTHYEYIATYVDDILSFSKNPMAVISEIKQDYVLKGIGAPEYYLGGNIDYLDSAWTHDGVKHALSARTYIENVTAKMETLFGHELRIFKTPMDHEYHPELDDSDLVTPREASKYRGMVGCCNWLITLGRFDINYATQALSRYSMAPRLGHFRAMQRVLGYLKKFPKGRIVIDGNHRDWSSYPPADPLVNWGEYYPDADEELPPNQPQCKGNKVRITAYVDADHAHDQLTRRSVTGIILFVNNTPVKWMSKKQKTVETSTYGSELVAARIATEMVMEVRYNLRMLGVEIDGPALMLGDNKSVVLNTTMPSSALKKKHNAIAYHRVRESIAAGILRFIHIPSSENLADFLTKPLPSTKFYPLTKAVLFRNARYGDNSGTESPNESPPPQN